VPSAPRIAALLALAGIAAFASACSGGGSGPVPTASPTPGGTSPASSPTPWRPTFQEFALAANRTPADIVSGADGNLWFNEPNAGMIGRMSTSGVLIGEYTVPNALQSSISGITLGSDNNVWFGNHSPNFIAKIDTSGNVSEIPLPANIFPELLTSGPDGNIWFSTTSGVGKLTPTSSATPTLYPLNTTAAPFGIISGPNGQIWFSDPSGHSVGHVTTSGSGLQEFPIPVPSVSYFPEELTMGPDGAVWTAGQASFPSGTPESVIGRITASGQSSYFLTPTQIAANLLGAIVTGPDNFIYAPETGQSPTFGGVANIARITPQTGHIDEAAIPSNPSNGVGGIVVGSDGDIWFTETGSSKIGRLLLH